MIWWGMSHGLMHLGSREYWESLSGDALYLQGVAPSRKRVFIPVVKCGGTGVLIVPF
jgi:hypothetical protein